MKSKKIIIIRHKNQLRVYILAINNLTMTPFTITTKNTKYLGGNIVKVYKTSPLFENNKILRKIKIKK